MANNIPINAVTVNNSKENIKYVLNKPDTIDTTGTRVGDLEKEINDFINITAPTTWKEVQDIVRAGKAPLYFNIGDQFVVNKSKLITITTNNNNTITLKVDNSSYIDAYLNNKRLQHSIDNYYIPIGIIKVSSGTMAWCMVGKNDNSDNEILDGTYPLGYYGLSCIGNDTTTVGDKINFADLKDYKEELAFDIIGFDHDVPTDTNYKHSMTLQLHDLYTEIPFDSAEATWFIDPTTYTSGLAVGTYQFGYKSKTYVFTTTKAVPAGGQLVYNFDTTSGIVITYGSSSSTDVLETCAVTEGTATNTLPDPLSKSHTTVTNDINRSQCGSNKYSESAIRQYINSSASSDWWTAKSIFDRPPINSNEDLRNIPGFLYGLESEFLDIVGNVNKITYLYDEDQPNASTKFEESSEKFFLLSAAEIYAVAPTTEYYDGTPYEYYIVNSANSSPSAAQDACRDKTLDGAASGWWLRSPYKRNSSLVRSIFTSGIVRHADSVSSRGVAPACTIV